MTDMKVTIRKLCCIVLAFIIVQFLQTAACSG